MCFLALTMLAQSIAKVDPILDDGLIPVCIKPRYGSFSLSSFGVRMWTERVNGNIPYLNREVQRDHPKLIELVYQYGNKMFDGSVELEFVPDSLRNYWSIRDCDEGFESIVILHDKFDELGEKLDRLAEYELKEWLPPLLLQLPHDLIEIIIRYCVAAPFVPE